MEPINQSFIGSCWQRFVDINWKALMCRFSLTFAMLAFFFNAILVSPFDEFVNNLLNPLLVSNNISTVNSAGLTVQQAKDVSIHLQVQAAMSIISILFGLTMSLMGIWVRSNKAWSVTAIIGFVAWAAMTVYAAYEQEGHRLASMDPPTPGFTTRPQWFLAFGWMGACCYFIAFCLAIIADQKFDKLAKDGRSLRSSNFS